ncbi:MAG: glycosyltransferase [Kiloniellales bacterium]|nr:glycosyltransferase [Kiloniellales bacterium]
MTAARPGKLLLVTRDVDGGIGQHIVDLAEDMAARGWEVHCVRAARSDGHVTGHSARLDRLPGVMVHAIPMARAIGPGDWRSYLAFRRVVRRHGPFDIAHGHGAKAGVFVRLPCRGIGARVYTPHGLITVDPTIGRGRRAVYGAIEAVLARFRTDALLAVSTKEREEALRLGTREAVCHKIPNGLAAPDLLPRACARAELGLGPEHRVALFVGRFCHAKAPERFLDLLAALAPERPDLRGVVIGGGERRPALVARAAALGLTDRLVFFETARAAAYMPAADLLLVPSRYEGFAYTMIEALAAGLPIVTYEVGGADDLVLRAHNGHIVPQGDAAGLAFRAAEILDEPAVGARMSAAARERYRLFQPAEMLDRIARVYERLRPRPAGRAAGRPAHAGGAGS